jgi:hypothetical protein
VSGRFASKVKPMMISRSSGHAHAFLAAALIAAMALSTPVAALTPLGAARYAADVPVSLTGTQIDPGDLGEDDLAGSVTLLAVAGVSAEAHVDAYHRLPSGDELYSFDVPVDLPGGVTAIPADVVRLSGGSYTLELDAVAAGVSSGVDTDAIATVDGGDLLVSFDAPVSLGMVFAEPGDAVRFDGSSFSLYFDASTEGVGATLDLDALERLANGHLLVSFDGSGTLGAVDFDDEDVLEYDPGTAAWELAYDGSSEHSGWAGANLSALGILFAPTGCGADADGDGTGDACDNCPNVANVDQTNSDCADPFFLISGGCVAPPPDKAGCCDGGDVCDACPAQNDNAGCDPLGSVVATIDASGGSVSTPNNVATIDVPLGALSSPTSVTLTQNGPATSFALQGASVVSLSARPSDQQFIVPVAITLRWADRDDDDVIDRGACLGDGSEPDFGLSCDANTDCTSNACTVNGAGTAEIDLVLKRNGQRFSSAGFGAGPFACADHLSGACSTAVADCTDAPGTGEATVAACCDTAANEWTFHTCSFSEFFLGRTAGDLVPGRGSAAKDCFSEWALNNPLNTPFFDNKGLPNFRQACRDGDTSCDQDGVADGDCELRISICLNVDDPRLLDQNGAPACAPAPVDTWLLKKPRPDSTKPIDAANAVALRAAVAALGSSTISGDHQEILTFAPAVSTGDHCTAPVTFTVPLTPSGRAGKSTLKMQSIAGGWKDSDKLKLTCLPAP